MRARLFGYLDSSHHPGNFFYPAVCGKRLYAGLNRIAGFTDSQLLAGIGCYLGKVGDAKYLPA
mgnify:CR=1 FL=1